MTPDHLPSNDPRHRSRRLLLRGLYSVTMLQLLSPTNTFAQNASINPIDKTQILGAGATLPSPLYLGWAQHLKSLDQFNLRYMANGSGMGRKMIFERQINFGASDVGIDFSKPESQGLIQFPTAYSGLVVTINLPGVPDKSLNLSPRILSAIFQGQITNWRHPDILKVNPDLFLPNLAITPVTRAESSGTTYHWTQYLSATDQDWAQQLGVRSSLNLGLGTQARGARGLALTIKQYKGSIGFIENGFAIRHKLSQANIGNPQIGFLKSSTVSFAKALGVAQTGDKSVLATTISSQEAWPMVFATYVLLPIDDNSIQKSRQVVQFFQAALTVGDSVASELHYLSLPQSIKEKIFDLWKTHHLYA